MEFLSAIYTEVFWRPLFNGLIFIYAVLPWRDLGLAIVVFTVAVRAVLAPLTWRAQKSQKELAALQPQIKRIQEEHKQNRDGQSKALMELYAKHKVNPFSGCLVMLVQIPILIALFQVFQAGLDSEGLKFIYSFVPNPGSLNPVSLGILDLSRGNIYLGIPAAITQYIQTRLTGTTSPFSSDGGTANDFARMMRTQALYLFPILILFWSYTLPSALTLYWTALNVFGIVQELLIGGYQIRKSTNIPKT